MDELVIPFADNTEFVSNYIFPVVLKHGNKERRNNIREFIHNAGIQTSIHYPAIHRFSIYKDYRARLPQTDYVTDSEFTLPMYAALTPEQVSMICDAVEHAVKLIR